MLWIDGTPRGILGASYDDVMVSVWMVFSCREKQWTPEEYLSQPAKWLAAYQYILPYLLDEYEANLERKRKEQELRSKKL